MLGTVRQASESLTLSGVSRAHHPAHAAGETELPGPHDSAPREPSMPAGTVSVQGAATPSKGLRTLASCALCL